MKRQVLIGCSCFLIGLVLVLAVRPFVVTGQEGKKGRSKPPTSARETTTEHDPEKPVKGTQCVCLMGCWARHEAEGYCSYMASFCNAGYGNFDGACNIGTAICSWNGSSCNAPCFQITVLKKTTRGKGDTLGHYHAIPPERSKLKDGLEDRTTWQLADEALANSITDAKSENVVTVLHSNTVTYPYKETQRKARISLVLVEAPGLPAQLFGVGREILPDQPPTLTDEIKDSDVIDIQDTGLLEITVGRVCYRILAKKR